MTLPYGLVMMLCAPTVSAASNADLGAFSRYEVHVPEESPKGLALVLSSALPTPKHNPLARRLTDEDYLTVVLNAEHWQAWLAQHSAECKAPAAALARLAMTLGAQHGLAADARPVLVADGATTALAYALANTPKTFHALLTGELCPRAELAWPSCGAAPPALHGRTFQPLARLGTPWYAFLPLGSTCHVLAQAFAHQVADARVTNVHGAALEAPEFVALIQWLDPSRGRQGAVASEVNNLPLIDVPAATTGNDTLAIFLSGDGGWAELDKAVSHELAAHGIRVIGWDSLSYYWQTRSPDEAAADLARVITHYSGALSTARVALIGYSFGADVLPFLVARLPKALREQVVLAAFLGLSSQASFEFHLSEWMGKDPTSTLPTSPEIAKLSDVRLLCVEGTDDEDAQCPLLPASGTTIRHAGDHHFDDDYIGLAALILRHLGKS
ncbi:MAG: hypothetical protein HYX63_08245 [Gammaproteobacteria bacterium]|nr:hypothetical protein [Gammaproteobacteria bacterium]